MTSFNVPPRDSYSIYEIAIIDAEASGLDVSSSYPIELAWVSLIGDNDTFLINPNSTDGWTHWDEVAETIHRIPRSECVSKGISVTDAATRLNSQLSGCIVLSDAVGFDSMWVNRLFDAASIERNFHMMDIRDFIISTGQDPKLIIKFFKEKKSREIPHRALGDCELLLEIGQEIGVFNNNVSDHKESESLEPQPELRTSAGWNEDAKIGMYDHDGWNRTNLGYSYFEELITQEEFNRRVSLSTTMITNRPKTLP